MKKIQSLKNIRRELKPTQNKSIVPEKKAPPLPNHSAVNNKPKKEEVKKQEKNIDNHRTNSTKKQPNLPQINDKKNIKSNRVNSENENEEFIEE